MLHQSVALGVSWTPAGAAQHLAVLFFELVLADIYIPGAPQSRCLPARQVTREKLREHRALRTAGHAAQSVSHRVRTGALPPTNRPPPPAQKFSLRTSNEEKLGPTTSNPTARQDNCTKRNNALDQRALNTP